MNQKKPRKLPRSFWSVNASNLFERGAYYGMLAVFSYHLIYNVGIESWTVGILTGISMGLINFLPLISTALASKYGFKKLLLLSYTTLAIGYVFLGFGYSLAMIVLAVVIMGTGSGFEKALIAASISHSSDDENRNYAFNVYYWIINTGAFAIPLSLTVLFVPAEYGSVFFLMAFFIVCSFLIILLSYKNPVQPDPSIPAFTAVKNLKVIVKDPKFALVLIIFSGCWFMLYTRQPFMPVFMTDFKILPEWFIPVLAAINPGTIITLGQVWAYVIKDWNVDSLKLLITGVIIVSVGFLIAGFSMNPVLFVVGIIVLSFGELVSYPAFLSYVSKIPPKEKRSIYMGFSFLPLAIAGPLASVVGGTLYYFIAENNAMGRLFWGIIACVGLVTASAFIYYDYHYNKEKKATADTEGFFRVLKKSPFHSKGSATIPLFFIPLILLLGVSLGADPIYRGILAQDEMPKDIDDDERRWEMHQEYFMYQGTLSEGTKKSWELPSPDEAYLNRIELVLSWEDEPDIRRIRRFRNTGDTFTARILIDGAVVKQASETNAYGELGRIMLSYDAERLMNTMDCNGIVEVELLECGDFYPVFGIGFLSIKDTSNSYELQVHVTYTVPMRETIV
jgi:proton-dependent oligopeptide transporter, POT family